MNLERHIWEGWTAKNFIDELEPTFNQIIRYGSPFKTANELKDWCKENQPYYKKHIPEVYNYFKKRLGL